MTKRASMTKRSRVQPVWYSFLVRLKRKRDADPLTAMTKRRSMTKRPRDENMLVTRTQRPRDDDQPLHQSSGKHTAFISHRGLEIKRGFADHLYCTLKDRGIEVFLDAKELPKGRDVRRFMLEAARKATIQIPIFTKIYAESTWCLDELVEMDNSTKSSSIARIFPVFFNVEPEELRNKDGVFGKAIKVHREKGRRDENTIQRWEAALHSASWLEGFRLESHNGFEGHLLKELVDAIVKEIHKRTVPYVDRNAVGLEERTNIVVEQFHLKEKRNVVFFLLLYGMGGIGKTTLALDIFHRLGNEFHASSFVESCGGVKASQIQERLCRDLLFRKDLHENDVGRLKADLKDGLREKKVLIIFDDVKNYDESIKKVIDLESLCRGSLILVTSRNQSVYPLKTVLSDGVFEGERYEVQGMGNKEALRLLCVHAFENPSPKPGFEALAQKVCEACAGLPLALEVLGCHLRRYEEEIMWEETIEKLRTRRYPKDTKIKIENILMISYNDLDAEEQEMFLDVACLLIDKEKRCAEYFWDSLGMLWNTALKRLMDLCLVKVGQKLRNPNGYDGVYDGECRFTYECLTMHDVLRDLGRAIVEKNCKWSRVWDDKILSRVLQNKKGLDQIRGLATSLPSLNAKLLSQMRSLRLLFLDGTILDGNDEGLKGLDIRWLRLTGWHRVAATQISVLKSLVVLEYGYVLHEYEHPDYHAPNRRPYRVPEVENPFSCEHLQMLQRMVLSGCSRLPENVGSLERLEELFLQQPKDEMENHVHPCTIHELPQLKKLQKLEILYCCQLPDDFGSLESLEEFQVYNVDEFQLPSSFGQLKKLRKFHLNLYELKQLPESFGSLESLEELKVEFAYGLTTLPSSFRELKKLRELHITIKVPDFDMEESEIDVESDTRSELLLEGFGYLESLEILVLTGFVPLVKLPSSFGQLKNLRKLDLETGIFPMYDMEEGIKAKQLYQLPEEFGSLGSLEELNLRAKYITKLPASFGKLKKLKMLELDCKRLKHLSIDFGSLETLEELKGEAGWIRKLPSSFGKLKKLKVLEFRCEMLEQLPKEFGSLESLEELKLSGTKLKKLPYSFGQLKMLRKIELGSSMLEQLPKEFGSLESLEELKLTGTNITKLPYSFGQLKKLRKLDLMFSWCLQQLPEDFGSLENLEELLLGSKCIRKFPSSFGKLKKLRRLELNHCNLFEQLPEDFASLESLNWLRVDESVMEKLPREQSVGWVKVKGGGLEWWLENYSWVRL